MTFTTLTFCLFLPLVFAAYWSFPRRMPQNLLIVAASYFFYGWWDARFCVLMLISSLVDFAAGLGIERAGSKRSRRILLVLSLAANLGMLGFFKYFNFFAASFQEMCAALDWHVDAVTLKVVLPVGISFYTFQTMSYVLDVYAGRLKPTKSLVEFLAYVSFFPQLVAGPIERATRFLPQFQTSRVFEYAKAVEGCRMILWGFFKKMVIADRISPFVDQVFGSISTASGPEILLATVAFAFQIYCDFSAYSDIATGTARLFGFDLMRNFAYPYFSESIGEFWRRWHISLSTWFRDYVYVPLGGSRAGKLRMLRNLFVTFVISGLWHGAAWTFVVWGTIMGLAMTAETLWGTSSKRSDDLPGGERIVPPARVLLRMAFTFGVVCLGWIFFRAASLSDALTALGRIATDTSLATVSGALSAALGDKTTREAVLAILAVVAAEWIQRRQPHPLVLDVVPRWQRWAVYSALCWLILFVGPQSQTQFLYFQF